MHKTLSPHVQDSSLLQASREVSEVSLGSDRVIKCKQFLICSPSKASLSSCLEQVVNCACPNQLLRLANHVCHCRYSVVCLFLIQLSGPISQSREYIAQQATIFGRAGAKKVTKYQQQVNEAAIQLSLQTPSLLTSRQMLLEEARKNVNNDGYIYKKGKSRSKQFSQVKECVPKRVKTSETFRVRRISTLEEDIKDFNECLNFNQASNSRNCKLCDMLTEEMSAIKQQKTEREAELHELRRKEKKSSWYKREKNRSESGSHISGSDEAEQSDALTDMPSSPQNQGLPECPTSVSPLTPRTSTPVNLPSSPPSRSVSHPGSPTSSSSPYTSVSTDHSVYSPCNLACNTPSADEQSQENQHFQ